MQLVRRLSRQSKYYLFMGLCFLVLAIISSVPVSGILYLLGVI